jgi:CheY-like chemotaxis protein
MDNQPSRVLILNSDPDALIELRRVFEEAGIDTAITWDDSEACRLLETKHFDLIIVGHHPPEIDAAAFRGTCPRVLILREIVRDEDLDFFRRVGAIGVVPKRDIVVVLERATTALGPM